MANIKKDEFFPEQVNAWHTGSSGSLNREGFLPPSDFEYPVRTNLPFAHGVASGDPLPDGILIWTRITLENYPNQSISGEWRIASDPSMRTILNDGTFSTSSEKDWTVHVDVSNLQAWTTYYFQFFYEGAESCVGRTRTAPKSCQVNESIRMAVVACSSYFSGYMNGYGRIADRQDVDFVVHCGDYIYEYPDEDEKVRIPKGDPEGIDSREPENLAEQRRRYALYRSDPDLFRTHQQHPFIILWDNHDISTRGELTHEQVYQAFWEWTPSRKADANDVYRRHQKFSYGQLADIVFMDRHYPKRYEDKEKSIANQSYLGSSQNRLLREDLLDSQKRNADWRVFINQVFLAQLHLINPPAGIDKILKAFFPNYTDGVILNHSQWDGVPEERELLFRFLRDNGINNNIVLTGDMHANWASDLHEDPSNLSLYNPFSGKGSVGVEFAPTSISRGGADENIRGKLGSNRVASVAADIAADTISAVLSTTNINAKYLEWSEHGYGIVDINSERATFEFWWTPIKKQSRKQRLGKKLICHKDSNHLSNAPLEKGSRKLAVDKSLAFEISPRLLHQY